MPKLQLLVIDDSALIRDFIRQGLYAVLRKIEILDATNGRHAKAVLETKSVDLVLCDWEMPEVNGQELLVWLRAHPRLGNLPFIMVTGRGERSHVVAAMRAGIDGYVIKPFSIEILAKQIKDVVAKRGLRFEIPPTLIAGAEAVAVLTGGTRKEDVQAAPDDLPDRLPPFDIAAAIARMAGKRDLVQKALVSFYTSFSGAPSEFDRLLAEGRQQEVMRLAHTIKGIAATLEATALTAATAALENALLHDPEAEVQGLVNAVKLALLPALAAAARVSPTKGGLAASPPSSATVVIDSAEVRRVIAVLRILVTENSAKARLGLASLREALKGANLDPALDAIEEPLRRFDFRVAEQALATLADSLPVAEKSGWS